MPISYFTRYCSNIGSKLSADDAKGRHRYDLADTAWTHTANAWLALDTMIIGSRAVATLLLQLKYSRYQFNVALGTVSRIACQRARLY